MGLNVMEIVGLVVVAVAGVLQISAVATLKWQTIEATEKGVKISGDYGLFKACLRRGILEACILTSDGNEYAATYRGVQATAILSILSVIGFIGAAILLKQVLKKSALTLIITLILGVFAVLFSMVTVIVYAEAIKNKEDPSPVFGASFYVSCVSVALDVIGVSIHVIGYRYSAAEASVMT